MDRTNQSRRGRVAHVAILLVIATVGALCEEASTDDETNTIPVVSTIETRSSRLLAEILSQAGDRRITDLSTADLIQVLDLASVASQEARHVRRSEVQSLIVPGWGHLSNGDRRRAALYFLADSTIALATAATTYWLLPPAIQWRNLNYLQTPLGEIRDRYDDLTAAELVPSLSVWIAGAILDVALRSFAARDARSVAIQAIEDGVVTFEPLPLVVSRRP
jgi:hypothetical protein